jgi:hypothetical protein
MAAAAAGRRPGTARYASASASAAAGSTPATGGPDQASLGCASLRGSDCVGTLRLMSLAA